MDYKAFGTQPKRKVFQDKNHEQTGYMISGRLLFTIGDERCEAEPGDSWNIPSNVEHDVEVLEDTVVIEVFSPAREDYLP